MENELFTRGKPLFTRDVEKDFEERNKERQLHIASWKRDFREVLCGDPAGRRVLTFLIDQSYLFEPFGQLNAKAYSLEGKREMGLMIASLVGETELMKALIKAQDEHLKSKEMEAAK